MLALPGRYLLHRNESTEEWDHQEEGLGSSVWRRANIYLGTRQQWENPKTQTWGWSPSYTSETYLNSEFSEAEGLKINIQKSVASLFTNNKIKNK